MKLGIGKESFSYFITKKQIETILYYKLSMRYLFFLLMLCFFAVSCTTDNTERKEICIIPSPNSQIENEGVFTISASTKIGVNRTSLKNIGSQFIHEVEKEINEKIKLNIGGKLEENEINFVLDSSLNLSFEAYQLIVSSKSVLIKASSENGLFYGMQSLLQLFSVSENSINLPALEITDAPRFEWRGMHLDVSRHFMPTSFIKKYIDYLAMNKLNVFHWHLVDGIGWRIEIKSHPELTEMGAWRVVKDLDIPWQDFEVWKKGDKRAKSGGFYTQEEIKEIVKYAQERYITVVPEIELPGHSGVVFHCYPDLVCKNKKEGSLNNIGVYCASNSNSYKLLEDVIDEVISLFPSEYIHIGGDEVNKSNWIKCADCQKLMKKKGFDEKGLQSHFVNHFDKYLISKERKLMGWHEILEGDLSESANIMYWGGINEFGEILEKGHNTVLSTGSSYYFDHNQSSSENEPPAWGGFSPLKQVYELNPISNDIESSFLKNILGIQANVWTEYMKTPEHVEYMVFPRMFALAENAWSTQENKSWDRFKTSVVSRMEYLKNNGVNCSYSAYRPIISTRIDSISKQMIVSIENELDATIYYTLDGSVPDIENGILYLKPFFLSSTKEIQAISVLEGEILTEVERKEAIVHKAGGCKIELKNEPYPTYSANGANSLLDLESGGNIWSSGKWLGFLDTGMEAIIHLNSNEKVSKVTISCIADELAHISSPEEMLVYISNNGSDYTLVKKTSRSELGYTNEKIGVSLNKFVIVFKEVNCRFIKVVASCPKITARSTFIFVDEIYVE